jgi:thioredoxin reductase/ferredoxin
MLLKRYVEWLHTGWPAGHVERLPEVNDDGTTAVPGVRVVGDLKGIPLLKFSADTGARAVAAILAEEDFKKRRGADGVIDLAIVGGGVSGISAALEAHHAGLRFTVFEAVQSFSTVQNFPKQKPIYTYPTEMTPAGRLALTANVKEALLDELEEQRKRAGIEPVRAHVERIERKGGELLVRVEGGEPVRALRVIIAIGRSGNYRQLGVPGEKLDKVYHRLYDPNDYRGLQALVVGGGDSALETAIALCMSGAHVTVSYRGKEFARAKPENRDKLGELDRDARAHVMIEEPTSERVNTAFGGNLAPRPHDLGSLKVMLESQVEEIREREVVVSAGGRAQTLANDVVFAMVGREPPLDFFRRSGIPIRGEWRARTWAAFLAFFVFCGLMYNWKSGGALWQVFQTHHWFPSNVPANIGDSPLLKTLGITLQSPSFYYSGAYSLVVAIFGWRRIKRRRTPYVTRQTIALILVQTIPLFLLPYILLPWLGHAGAFDHGVLKTIADHLMPACNYDHGREYWRAFGLVLAWPLFIYNFFTDQPNTWWLIIGCVQTFVLIPLAIRRWGKGVYCGWICSCGALAETLGDTQRQKMPHGPRWNRLNLVGQVILVIAFALFALRIVGWVRPQSFAAAWHNALKENLTVLGVSLDYKHLVDTFLAGVVGVGFYFWFSGRVWCRFACPLAALMHIYARFSKFRIFADKKKCISCNVCTSVCHQGIDVMSFANKGLGMEDPECVRCSACVQSCPTGTLTFGRVGKGGAPIYDRVAASPVQMAESSGGKRVGLRVVA